MVKKKKENLTDFQIKLEQGGELYQSSGATIFDAISAVQLDRSQIKTKGTLVITKDGKTLEHLFYLPQLRRLFSTKLASTLMSRNLTYLFTNKAQ